MQRPGQFQDTLFLCSVGHLAGFALPNRKKKILVSYRKLSMIVTSRYSRREDNLASGFIFQKLIYKEEI